MPLLTDKFVRRDRVDCVIKYSAPEDTEKWMGDYLDIFVYQRATGNCFYYCLNSTEAYEYLDTKTGISNLVRGGDEWTGIRNELLDSSSISITQNKFTNVLTEIGKKLIFLHQAVSSFKTDFVDVNKKAENISSAIIDVQAEINDQINFATSIIPT